MKLEVNLKVVNGEVINQEGGIKETRTAFTS